MHHFTFLLYITSIYASFGGGGGGGGGGGKDAYLKRFGHQIGAF